jgi:1-acyl-sn-glycerol-3-phosphate acyltransferase
MFATEHRIATPAYTHPGIAEAIIVWLGEALRWLLLFPVLRLFIHITTIGTDTLTKGQPYVFAANHSSHLDAPILLAALPLHLRLQVRVAAAADYFFTSYWKGMLVSLFLNAFAFERKGTGCYASLAHAQQLLAKGHSLLIFPEGTRTGDGQIRHFKQGVGRLALKTSVSVVPTWIGGTFTALPKGSYFPRHQQVVVKFGTPMHFTSDSDPTFIATEVERQVRALACPEKKEENR